MQAYFHQLYANTNDFDVKKMESLLYHKELNMEEAAMQFHLIDDTTAPVIVNWGNSMELVERLKRNGVGYALMKQLAQYSVSVGSATISLPQRP